MTKVSYRPRYNGFVVGALLMLALAIIWDSKPFAIGATLFVAIEVLFNIEEYKAGLVKVKNTPSKREKA